MDNQTMELLQTIARVKRATGNGDIVTVCNALESRLLVRPAPIAAPEQVRVRFDKTKYMKTYMAKRRAEARRPKGVV